MNIHFIAIGGAAMHNLAIALHKKGYQITGSDDVIFDPSKSRLEKYGLLPEKFGWYPEKINEKIDAIILGMHAQSDNPELKKAQELGLHIYSYPEYLYLQSKKMNRVVVAGSHGKTTITSMILHVLDKVGKEVNYMVGSQLKGFETMVKLDDSLDTIILEGDEYLSSPIDSRPKILWYKPHTTVISGIAWDHINKFPIEEEYNKIFAKYMQTIEKGGNLIYISEDAILNEYAEKCIADVNKIAYKTPEYYSKDKVYYIKTKNGDIPMKILGKHNMQNMEAARKVCKILGVNDHDFYQSMQSFEGADKRLEKIYDKDGKTIFKDFAHAPSKVIASVKAVRESYPNKKITAVLELHTYSSLNKNFLPKYKDALNPVDRAIVFYSPDAMKIKRMEAIPPELIIKAFNRDDLLVFTDPKELHKYLYNHDFSDQVLLMMSSGNYGKLDLEKLF